MTKFKGMRWWMVSLVTAGLVVNYLARNTLSVAAPTMMQTLDITTEQYAHVVVTWQLCYAFVQPVAGWIIDAIGTKGVARMTHNFVDATIELFGVHETIRRTAPFNDKKLDVMVDVVVRSVLCGKNLGVPQARDSVIASEISWAMLNDAIANMPPVRGTPEEMRQILEHRRNLSNGFGLPVRHHDLVESR